MEKNEQMKNDFEAVVESTSTYLYSVAFRLTGSTYDAKDLLQETYLKAWRNWDQLRDKEKALPWLRKICVNLFIDNNKKAGRRRLFDLVEVIPKPDRSLDMLTPEEEVLGDEAVKKFQSRCFSIISTTLPPNQRVVFVLIDIFELSIDDTANLMQKSKSAIKALLFRARKNLTNDMGGYCGCISTQNICRCETWMTVARNAEKRREFVQAAARDLENKEYDKVEAKKKLLRLFRELPLLSPPEMERLSEWLT